MSKRTPANGIESFMVYEAAHEAAAEDRAVAGLCYTTQDEANAKLIAAAPELLDALMRMVYTYAPADDYEIRSLAIAKAAIAKATGDDQ